MIHPPETISVLVSGWGYREKSGFTTSAVRASSVKVYTKKIYWNNTETNQLVSGDMLRDSKLLIINESFTHIIFVYEL